MFLRFKNHVARWPVTPNETDHALFRVYQIIQIGKLKRRRKGVATKIYTTKLESLKNNSFPKFLEKRKRFLTFRYIKILEIR